ncbi:MAG: UvrD-helicase domain-containing protein [Collinsella sp.]|nr:UvrD-helicase domain-containing protein [Collinsella sp.]
MDLSTLMPQQRDIVRTLDGRLFVSAGAGSGKTFTLTRRILWALSPESGPFIHGLDEVLAITFTKDAAAEIRERVRRALLDEGMSEVALEVDDAWISTIHGMCSRILHAHALELGLDPEFSVLEDAAASDLMDQAVDRVIDRSRGGLRDLLSWYPLVAEIGANGSESGESVRSLVRTLLDKASASRHGFDDVRLVGGGIDLSGLMDAYRQCLDTTPKAAEVARAALQALEAFLAGPRTREDLAACILACDIPRASKALPKEQVALLKAEAADAFVNAYLACGSDALDELLSLARDVFDEYVALKSERSVLDNNDLLRLTYEALRDRESIRRIYAGRFSLVMIDEFQDTDQQQVDLIEFLTGEGGRTLCTVGDAQQSIYRFRGAEVEVFRRAQREAEAPAVPGRGASGTVVELVKNFRSHASVLEYVARVFDDANGGIMPGFLNLLPHEGRADGLCADGASRRQAVLVAGGTIEERTEAKARAIARRFAALAAAGQPVGDMVLLLGGMPRAGVYADALRAEGLDCVISGGSVFASTVEAKTVRALARSLANPADAAQGLAPVLASPLFSLGAQEFLALCTTLDPVTGETRRRNVDAGLMSREDAPGFGPLPLLDRARTVMGRALGRVGRDRLSDIARDVVNESGWMVRLAAQGPEGRARAANVLKALDALASAEASVGDAPRQIALAFDRFLAGKQAPGALNEEGGNAVRIMTVHASKGLEFPIVAVSECFGIRPNKARMQCARAEDGTLSVAFLPSRYPNGRASDGSFVDGEELRKRFKRFLTGGSAGSWLDLDLADDVCATGSAAEAWLAMRAEEDRLSLEERARLLYVAMTRAREVCLLAMDAGTRSGRVPELALDPDRDLVPSVLERILPDRPDPLSSDRLVFEDSRSGDFELVSLCDFVHQGQTHAASVPGGEPSSDEGDVLAPVDEPMDSFTLASPAALDYRVVPAFPPRRRSYSYSSISAALHAAQEDRAVVDAMGPGEMGGASSASDPECVALEPAPEDPTALGSAFHAAAQWMVETGCDDLPDERLDALCRFWRVSPGQRSRLVSALARWRSSSVRAEALSWPLLRAEVPFHSIGSDELAARFGEFAEGAIDLLCTDPDDISRALVVDYKTGGSPREDPARLEEKHALQARVYADALRKAGFGGVSLRFVRVEVPDPIHPDEPQVVSFEF